MTLQERETTGQNRGISCNVLKGGCRHEAESSHSEPEIVFADAANLHRAGGADPAGWPGAAYRDTPAVQETLRHSFAASKKDLPLAVAVHTPRDYFSVVSYAAGL